MQKRPYSHNGTSSKIDLVYSPIQLDGEFPLSTPGNDLYFPDSAPLTYLHYHDYLEIGYCFEGSGIFIVDHKILPFASGDVSIIFKNEIHIAKSNPDSPSGWHFITLNPIGLLNDMVPQGLPQLFSFLDGSRDFKNIVKKDENPGLVSIVQEIVEEIRAGKGMYKQAIKGLVLCLLAKLSRESTLTADNIRHSKHRNIVRISPSLDYILKNHDRQINIPELAILCGMSMTNFRRTFTKVMGVGPKEYINQFKIRMASVLLAGTDISVLDVSIRTGYESLSSFNRNFKRLMGVTPLEWRKQSGGLTP